MDPTWAKCLKSGQNFSRSGQKKFIHVTHWHTFLQNIVDSFEFAKNKAFGLCIQNVNTVLIGLFLEILQLAFLAHGAIMRWLLRMQLFSHRWHIRGSQQCTVCRQCTTFVWCGSCLSQSQIRVCASRLMHLLSISKFSLSQSASTVTKSQSSPAGASCQLQKKR